MILCVNDQLNSLLPCCLFHITCTYLEAHTTTGERDDRVHTFLINQSCADHHFLPTSPSAETSVPDDFLCDPVDSKRYAVDPSDSAFGVMATGFQPKHSYGYRGSSGCSNPMVMCRQASSPRNFQDPNRNTGECVQG